MKTEPAWKGPCLHLFPWPWASIVPWPWLHPVITPRDPVQVTLVPWLLLPRLRPCPCGGCNPHISSCTRPATWSALSEGVLPCPSICSLGTARSYLKLVSAKLKSSYSMDWVSTEERQGVGMALCGVHWAWPHRTPESSPATHWAQGGGPARLGTRAQGRLGRQRSPQSIVKTPNCHRAGTGTGA